MAGFMEKVFISMSGFMRGEPLVAKLAVLAKYAVLPGAMAVALIYSPPDYALPKKQNPPYTESLE